MSRNSRETTDEDYPSTDDYLFGMLFLPMRLNCLKDLLAGNDTQCFTTEQYLKRFIAREHIDFPEWAKRERLRPKMCSLTTARSHLKGLEDRGYVREVKPDVWSPVTERVGYERE